MILARCRILKDAKTHTWQYFFKTEVLGSVMLYFTLINTETIIVLTDFVFESEKMGRPYISESELMSQSCFVFMKYSQCRNVWKRSELFHVLP